MHIERIEIANFRKLLAVRVEIAVETTLFVGANNSGKSSAILALRKFLSPHGPPFETHDFTLCHWPVINSVGQGWIEASAAEQALVLSNADWSTVVPTLDLWLDVQPGELHYVRDVIPTLDWEGGALGVRLRYEPRDPEALFKEFILAHKAAQSIRQTALAAKGAEVSGAATTGSEPELAVWPNDLLDFLSRRLQQHFVIRVYTLDPGAVASPHKGQARLQVLRPDAMPVEGKPLADLLRVDDIPAQRGFGDARPSEGDERAIRAGGGRLSDQLRAYYVKHLDPTDRPDPRDLGALRAIQAAQTAFDDRLTESFTMAFAEVESLGYPGVSDPRPKVSTRLKAIDGLNHAAAVSFEVDVIGPAGTSVALPRLPEDFNGLGYQNLISMIFRLMSFRDGWMRVGKATKTPGTARTEPLHLVLVEEPEAHLHAQVQQVFIKKAYAVLRAHDALGKKTRLRTQLVVSTHSSHVAHETTFGCLRYFQRLPAGIVAQVPVSAVISLSDVFGPMKETERFVTRYLRAQHADLFFADAVILVEGPAERMLLPNLIRSKHPLLNRCYISVLEIGGSHAHRLRPLIESLGLLTLVITDLDSLAGPGGASVPPLPKKGQVTNNATLKKWLPEAADIDALYAADENKKVKQHDQISAVRVAYQMPLKVKVPKTGREETAYPYTFEDALAFENIEFFSGMLGTGLVAKFRTILADASTAEAIGTQMHEALKGATKAQFALDIIDAEAFDELNVPGYIEQGLQWLGQQLVKKQLEALIVPEIVLQDAARAVAGSAVPAAEIPPDQGPDATATQSTDDLDGTTREGGK